MWYVQTVTYNMWTAMFANRFFLYIYLSLVNYQKDRQNIQGARACFCYSASLLSRWCKRQKLWLILCYRFSLLPMGKFVLNEKNSLWYLLSNKGSKNLKGGGKAIKSAAFPPTPLYLESLWRRKSSWCEGKILRGFTKHTKSIVPKNHLILRGLCEKHWLFYFFIF